MSHYVDSSRYQMYRDDVKKNITDYVHVDDIGPENIELDKEDIPFNLIFGEDSEIILYLILAKLLNRKSKYVFLR